MSKQYFKKLNEVFGLKKVLRVEGMALVQLSQHGYGSLRRALTVTSTGKNRRFTLELYREYKPRRGLIINTKRDKLLWIPRNLVTGSGVLPSMDRRRCTVGRIHKKYKLREAQEPIIKDYHKAIRTTNPYGGVLQAPTGTGKTVIGIDIMINFGMTTLIVVPLDRLFLQWPKELLERTSLKERDIGYIRQSQCSVRGKKVVIGMLHSLAQKKYADFIYNYFGHVIFDEVQFLGAEHFSTVAPMFNRVISTGLSATARRKDGMTKVFKAHIGDVVAEHKIIKVHPEVVIYPFISKNPKSNTSSRGCIWGGEFSFGRYVNKVVRSEERNELLAKVIKILWQRRRKTLILTDRIRHIEELKRLLRASGVPAKAIGIFTQKIKQDDRPITLGTYGSAGIGVDMPWLTGIVFATPRGDIIQPAGRVLREYKDKYHDNPIIVDIVDVESPQMITWARSRFRYYKSITKDINNKCEKAVH